MCSIFGLTSARVPRELIETCFNRTISRGPDMSRLEEIPGGVLGFHRLAIMGLNERGIEEPMRFQFERMGYFCTDRDSTPEHLVFNRSCSLKDSWAKIKA